MFKLILLLAIIGATAVAWIALRRQARLRQGALLLSRVAAIFGGEARPALRVAGWGSVQFHHAGYAFTLRREEQLSEQAVEACCVVEAVPDRYLGPEVELLARGERPSRLLAPAGGAVELEVDGLGERFCAWGEAGAGARLTAILADPETRRLLGYALDKRGARLHLSARAVWFECAGFPENGELLASIARTGAAALARLLDRART